MWTLTRKIPRGRTCPSSSCRKSASHTSWERGYVILRLLRLIRLHLTMPVHVNTRSSERHQTNVPCLPSLLLPYRAKYIHIHTHALFSLLFFVMDNILLFSSRQRKPPSSPTTTTKHQHEHVAHNIFNNNNNLACPKRPKFHTGWSASQHRAGVEHAHVLRQVEQTGERWAGEAVHIRLEACTKGCGTQGDVRHRAQNQRALLGGPSNRRAPESPAQPAWRRH
mmetsp:Transcript_5537/g.14392  ORF Transcript_5537/g.14392 Transcript_5537/m.14392 type:complete len:223 (+) Transcript_5537:342-1010(+)